MPNFQMPANCPYAAVMWCVSAVRSITAVPAGCFVQPSVNKLLRFAQRRALDVEGLGESWSIS